MPDRRLGPLKRGDANRAFGRWLPWAAVSIAEGVHRALGLTDEEAAGIEAILGRPANHLELAMYAVMWSEHCSYKSSRIHLRRLPTTGARVLVGPGENAGVIDAGDGVAVAIRIESHNHPSAIEPYQGAATGVGGILRDIFTMGARPIALMDPLRFGPLDDPRSRWIFEGVVRGISGYGNSVGVPTVGGELAFDPCYAGNPLVNVLCVGVMPVDRLVLGRASGPGNLAVLLGSRTGRDGIGGVSVLASAGFEEDATGTDGANGVSGASAKRPSVQVGDPYEEKRLIEACLELLTGHLVVGIQDLGGAGLTCATSETASRGGVGMDVDVTAVPRREPGMEPFEVMTSESQERMLAIVAPDDLDAVLETCRRWEVRAAVVGRVTDGGRLRILDGWDGEVLADVPAASLHEDAPLYERPCVAPVTRAQADGLATDNRAAEDGAADDSTAGKVAAAVCALLIDAAPVYRQYDHQLFLNTVVGPGSDATVLRLKAPGVNATRHDPLPSDGPAARKALALSTDGNGRWCAVDPRRGTAWLVAESALNVACAGAEPVALVNCLNFGNPEHPEVMWQLSESIDGMAEACRALDIPVIGGNVSLYNESAGTDIDPTPVVAVLGLIDELVHRPPLARLVAGQDIVLLGARRHELAGSAWADRHGVRVGPLPPVDFEAHQALLDLVRALVSTGTVSTGTVSTSTVSTSTTVSGPVGGIHDVSDGGLAVTLTEMAVAGGVGFEVADISGIGELFSEAPSRVVVCTDDADAVLAAGRAAGVPAVRIGTAGGSRLVVVGRSGQGLLDLDLEAAVAAGRDRLRPPVAP
jgi:phosphoribosylformylglycinamidine synthase II